jgi:hypothetical protein
MRPDTAEAMLCPLGRDPAPIGNAAAAEFGSAREKLAAAIAKCKFKAFHEQQDWQPTCRQ